MAGQPAYNGGFTYDWNFNNYGPTVPNYSGYHPLQSGYAPVFQPNTYLSTQQDNGTGGGGGKTV